jgi:hypothetical protein
VHWSLTPALDAQVASRIDPSLRVPSLLRYLGHTYFVRPFTREPAPALRGQDLSSP